MIQASTGPLRSIAGSTSSPTLASIAASVTLSLANHDASLPIAYQLYLPEDWAKDQARRQKAKIPETIAFQTKPEIAFEQIKVARTAGLPQGVVLMDAGYGNDTGLRTEITALGMSYVAGIGPNTSFWPAGASPIAATGSIGAWATTEASSTRWAAPAELGQGTRLQPTGRSVANHHLARGSRGLALVALCPTQSAAGASR